MATTQVMKGLIMSGSRLLNWNRRCVLSARDFTDSDDVRRFDQAWLRKATDIVEGKRGNVNQSRKRPAAAGLFFDFGDGRSTTIFIVLLRLSGWQMMGRRMVVANRSERLSLPMESFLQRGGWGRSWVGGDTSNVSGVERKNKQKEGCLKM